MNRQRWRNPGLWLAVVLTLAWSGMWLLPDLGLGPWGLPWLTWGHILLGLAAVGSTIWATGALTRWEDGPSRHPN
ncbi:MAG: hypothetical protein IT442_13835 [Phycisphaeraceae bacterium]|nr:hypothetical protein [Phycisphaeraceae bacterium]